jgi:hypothetical protein
MRIDEVSSVDLDKLPSLTSLIPTYSEALLFMESYLRDMQNKKVSNLEFLTQKFKEEWNNFALRIAKTYKVPNDPEWLLNTFLVHENSLLSLSLFLTLSQLDLKRIERSEIKTI